MPPIRPDVAVFMPAFDFVRQQRTIFVNAAPPLKVNILRVRFVREPARAVELNPVLQYRGRLDPEISKLMSVVVTSVA